MQSIIKQNARIFRCHASNAMRVIIPDASVTKKKHQTSCVTTHSALSQLDTKNVVYIGYIGSTSDVDLYKFGISRAVANRYKTHVKTFGAFELCYLAEYDRNYAVEKMFSSRMKTKGLLINGFKPSGTTRTQREVVGLPRYENMTFVDLLLEIDNLVDSDSTENADTHRGHTFVRKNLNVSLSKFNTFK